MSVIISSDFSMRTNVNSGILVTSMICLRPHVVLLEDFLVDVITNLIIYSASRPPKCLEGLFNLAFSFFAYGKTASGSGRARFQPTPTLLSSTNCFCSSKSSPSVSFSFASATEMWIAWAGKHVLFNHFRTVDKGNLCSQSLRSNITLPALPHGSPWTYKGKQWYHCLC
jgi:hypothetical protein